MARRITAEEVYEIRKRWLKGDLISDMAADFDVSTMVIRNTGLGRTGLQSIAPPGWKPGIAHRAHKVTVRATQETQGLNVLSLMDQGRRAR